MGSPLIARLRSFISCVVAFSLALSHIPAAADPLSKTDYEACQARDETAFRAAIEAISVRALKAGIAKVDYRAVVGDAWRRGGLDDIIDKQVDKATDEVAQETSWANLMQSLANQQKAQQLATAVAERVYRSDQVKGALEELALSVGNEVGKQIEFAGQDATEPTLACLKAFVGARYGTTVARAAGGDASKEFSVDAGKAFQPATEARGASSDGVDNLQTTPTGYHHVFAWDAAADLHGQAQLLADLGGRPHRLEIRLGSHHHCHVDLLVVAHVVLCPRRPMSRRKCIPSNRILSIAW